jgi:hypothetical protein
MNVLFWLEPFARHMDGLCWLLMRGLALAGWQVVGHGFPAPGDTTDVIGAVVRFAPRCVLFWTGPEWGTSRPEHRALGVTDAHVFRGWERLKSDHPRILRGTFIVDAGSNREAQRDWHIRLRPHVYLSPYHPTSVVRLNAHILREQIIRYHHPIEPEQLPAVEPRDGRCVISGATGTCYPLRCAAKVAAHRGALGHGITVIEHPGYHDHGNASVDYARTLALSRVALATSSVYGFALRKHIEATAVGCRVVTDLPEFDRLPEIDENLVRVRRDVPMPRLAQLILQLADSWQLEVQRVRATQARAFYDYRAVGARITAALAGRQP